MEVFNFKSDKERKEYAKENPYAASHPYAKGKKLTPKGAPHPYAAQIEKEAKKKALKKRMK